MNTILTLSFLLLVQQCENQYKDIYYPEKSFEGGDETIGYGHKIQRGEDFSQGISQEKAVELLKEDLRLAKNRIPFDISDLPVKNQQFLIELSFNVGDVNKFPKFTKACRENNWKVMQKEYKRYCVVRGKRVELKQRNKLLFSFFFSDSNK